MNLNMLIDFFEKKYTKYFGIISRHLIISALCGTIDYLVFIYCYKEIQLGLSLSQACSILIASSIGFMGHSFYTFKTNQVIKKNIILFASQMIIVFFLAYLSLKIMILSEINIWIAKFIQLLITFCFNVIYGKNISFKER
jgi:putative flippase GtrA